MTKMQQILTDLREWRKHSPEDSRHPNNMHAWHIPELLDYIRMLEEVAEIISKGHLLSYRLAVALSKVRGDLTAEDCKGARP